MFWITYRDSRLSICCARSRITWKLHASAKTWEKITETEKVLCLCNKPCGIKKKLYIQDFLHRKLKRQRNLSDMTSVELINQKMKMIFMVCATQSSLCHWSKRCRNFHNEMHRCKKKMKNYAKKLKSLNHWKNV